jgi:hypothetical protein
MKPRKRTSGEPSLRNKLSESYLRAFEADFAANGAVAIEKLRERNPAKYSEIASRLIAAVEPPVNPMAEANSISEIAVLLLQNAGISDPSPDESFQAIEAHDIFMATMERIKASHIQ